MTDLPQEVSDAQLYKTEREVREHHAQKARDAKTWFIRLKAIVVIGTALAAIAGGLLLLGLETGAANDEVRLRVFADKDTRLYLLLFQGLCLAAVTGSTVFLNRMDYPRQQVDSRLKAEEGRLSLARMTLEISHAAGPAVFGKAADWFGGFIDGQIGHLKNSAEDHKAANLIVVIVIAVIAMVGTLGTAFAGVDSYWIIALVALIGVLSPALNAALTSWGDATMSNERAKLHEASWLALSKVRGRDAELKAAVEQHNLEAALTYAEEAFTILRADHRGFADLHGGKKSGEGE